MIFLVFFKDWFTAVHGSAVSFICPAVPLVSGAGLFLDLTLTLLIQFNIFYLLCINVLKLPAFYVRLFLFFF